MPLGSGKIIKARNPHQKPKIKYLYMKIKWRFLFKMGIVQNLQDTLCKMSKFHRETMISLISSNILQYIDGHEAWDDEKRSDILNYAFTYITNYFLDNTQDAFSFSNEQWGNRITWALHEDQLRGFSEIRTVIDNEYEIEDDPRKIIEELVKTRRDEIDKEREEERQKELKEKAAVDREELKEYMDRKRFGLIPDEEEDDSTDSPFRQLLHFSIEGEDDSDEGVFISNSDYVLRTTQNEDGSLSTFCSKAAYKELAKIEELFDNSERMCLDCQVHVHELGIRSEMLEVVRIMASRGHILVEEQCNVSTEVMQEILSIYNNNFNSENILADEESLRDNPYEEEEEDDEFMRKFEEMLDEAEKTGKTVFSSKDDHLYQT